MEGSIKAVIYARYSSDNQREESIEGQIRECTAFAEKNGISINLLYHVSYQCMLSESHSLTVLLSRYIPL